MVQFIVRRLLQLIPVLLGVTIIVFSLMHLTPGNPAHIIAGENAPPATIAQIEKRLGLKAHDNYGLSEIMGPGVSASCD